MRKHQGLKFSSRVTNSNKIWHKLFAKWRDSEKVKTKRLVQKGSQCIQKITMFLKHIISTTRCQHSLIRGTMDEGLFDNIKTAESWFVYDGKDSDFHQYSHFETFYGHNKRTVNMWKNLSISPNGPESRFTKVRTNEFCSTNLLSLC